MRKTKSRVSKQLRIPSIQLIESLSLPLEAPVWYPTAVKSGQRISIKAIVEYLNIDPANTRKAVLLIRAYDKAGNEVDVAFNKMAWSETFSAHFRYLAPTQNVAEELYTFVIPEEVTTIHFGFNRFLCSDDEQVVVSDLTIFPEIETEIIESNRKLETSDNHVVEKLSLPLEAPVWYPTAVKSGQRISIKAIVEYLNIDPANTRKAVLLIRAYDKAGNEVDVAFNKMAWSETFSAHFRYLAPTQNVAEELYTFVIPEEVTTIHFGFNRFLCSDDEQVVVSDLTIYPQEIEEEQEKPSKSIVVNQSLQEDNTIYQSSFLSYLVNQKFIDSKNTPFQWETITLNNNEKKEVGYIKVSDPESTFEVFSTTTYQLNSNELTRKAVVLLTFIDEFGRRIEEITNIGISSLFNQHYRYLNNNKNTESPGQLVLKVKLPSNVSIIKLEVAGIGLNNNDKVLASLQTRFSKSSKLVGTNQSHSVADKSYKQSLLKQPLPTPITYDSNSKRYTTDLTVACVLDEFTAECVSHEVNLIKVTQENWQSQLEANIPDFLLVESCWRGNDGNWGALTRGSGGNKKLTPLLQYCKNQGIPTVFWNKEDPPHYEKFGAIAKLFDLAITTDVNMVSRYKEDFGIDVYPLSFGAQPKIHNPSFIIPRLDKAVFAGSYYGDKPKRCLDFESVITAVEDAGVSYDIFDRNYYRGIDKFAFPERYHANIVGNLPPDEVWRAHKGYKYQINMNSVQDSSTMFARRVYESLASGTPVISNDSIGVRELFGDLVIMDKDDISISERLQELASSPVLYNELARQGVRRVMREHTYGHRIQQICQLLGINVEVALPKATLAVTASSKSDIKKAKSLFRKQTAPYKHLFIELNNFDSAYSFLNESDEDITYAMKLGHKFYLNDNDFYQDEVVLKCDAKDNLEAEALEDFTYWGEL